MDLITLKKKFKQHNNFSKIFNHNKKAKQEFQRLEFLGDRVLALILSHEIYSRFTRFNEGRLATIFSYLTSSTTLSKIAKNLQLDLFIKKKTSGRIMSVVVIIYHLKIYTFLTCPLPLIIYLKLVNCFEPTGPLA